MKKAVALLLVLIIFISMLCSCTTYADTSSNDSSFSSADTSEYKINVDLLSEIGMTYSQLKQKYGEITKALYEHGGPIYCFKGDDVWYNFDEIDWGDRRLPDGSYQIPTGEDGYLVFEQTPLPKNDSKCDSLWYHRAQNVFLGLTGPTSAAEIAQKYNVTLESSDYDHLNQTYRCGFIYNDKYISVQTKEDYVINPEAFVFIKINEEPDIK